MLINLTLPMTNLNKACLIVFSKSSLRDKDRVYTVSYLRGHDVKFSIWEEIYHIKVSSLNENIKYERLLEQLLLWPYEPDTVQTGPKLGFHY